MSKRTALQRGNVTTEAAAEAVPVTLDAAIFGELRHPRAQTVAGLLSGTPPSEADREELLLVVQAATGWLARDATPRVVLSTDRKVLWCNRSATRMLRPPQPLYLRGSSVALSSGEDEAPFAEYLARLHGSIERYLLGDADSERAMLISGWSLIRGEASAYFLEFVLRELPLDARSSGMARQFGLTRAECEIVDCVAEMATPSDIAARLGVSVNTVRTHMRSIYAKLGISTQLQLVRTILAYCG